MFRHSRVLWVPTAPPRAGHFLELGNHLPANTCSWTHQPIRVPVPQPPPLPGPQSTCPSHPARYETTRGSPRAPEPNPNLLILGYLFPPAETTRKVLTHIFCSLAPPLTDPGASPHSHRTPHLLFQGTASKNFLRDSHFCVRTSYHM